MASSYSFLLFLLLMVVPPCLCLFDVPDLRLPSDRPYVVMFDEDPQFFKQRYLRIPRHNLAPWIAVDEERITAALSDTSGFKIASAILQKQHPLNSLLVSVNEYYKQRRGPTLFVPNCDGITVYIRALENEDEILEKNPGILDDLRSGRRHVESLNKTVERFYGGGNVTLSHPYLYTPDVAANEGINVHGAHRFGSLELELPAPRGGGENYNKLLSVEMVIVASVVPDNHQKECDYHRDSFEGQIAAMMYDEDDLEFVIWVCKLGRMPYGTTMLISLLF